MPTVAVPPLPLPVFARVVDGIGELDSYAASVRELGERDDASLDEEACRVLIDFARGLRRLQGQLMASALVLEEVAVRCYDGYAGWRTS